MLTRTGFLVIPQNLVIVDASSFGNNINDALTLAGANPANAQAIVTSVITAGVTDIVGIVNRLYAAGSRNILLVTVPDIGKTPLVQATGNPTAIATATTMSAQDNGALAQQMNNLRVVSPGLVISTLDLFALLTQVQANPGAFGFANATMACFVPTNPPSLCSPDAATQNTYVFWDPFHPTAGTGADCFDRDHRDRHPLTLRVSIGKGGACGAVSFSGEARRAVVGARWPPRPPRAGRAARRDRSWLASAVDRVSAAPQRFCRAVPSSRTGRRHPGSPGPGNGSSAAPPRCSSHGRPN